MVIWWPRTLASGILCFYFFSSHVESLKCWSAAALFVL
jgi:hypothetical protein